MLVLTRRVGEEIVIAGHIRVKVLAQQGRKIRLGFTTANGVQIDREEVHQLRSQRADSRVIGGA